MNILLSVLYGFLGLILGYKIPDLSLKIMEYKKGRENIKKSKEYLYSNWFNFALCIFNGGVWAFVGLNIYNPFIVFLIGSQITMGLIIAFIDINIRIIPNELVLIIVILGIVFQLMNFGLWALLGAIISMIVMMVGFTSVAGFVGFGKVGAGDVKLAGAMGLALGYPLVITAVGIMSVVLLLYILIGMAMKKVYLSTMLPLAPFMIAGYISVFITLII